MQKILSYNVILLFSQQFVTADYCAVKVRRTVGR